MRARYVHTNIIARDWRKLAHFYETVFGCVRLEPERRQAGAWLERGTGVVGAALEGVHLRLPGHGDNGPTLEIYTYKATLWKPESSANRQGLRHLAFAVDDVAAALGEVIGAGGAALGEIVTTDVPGTGHITFVYATDPEGNILEIQKWS